MPDQPKKVNHRVRTGFAFAGIACSMAVLGGWYWSFMVLLLFFTSFQELAGIMRANNIRPSHLIVITVGILLVFLAGSGHTKYFSVVITGGIIASFLRLLFRQPRASISDIGATLLGFFYTGYLPAHFILLRNMGSEGISNPLEQPGLGYLFLTIFILSASDIVAYYAGKRFGKVLLYPEISPKKTKEGSISGLIGAVIVAMGFSMIIDFPLIHAFILGILLSVVGQLGDLSESLLKRDAGMKDSGSMLKGHGGVLDRIDSYIFSGAVSYYYIHWVVLHQGLAQDLIQFFR